MGTVKDGETGEPLPFVNIYFKGTTIGVTSDFNGKFSMETYKPGDSLMASFVGYVPQGKPVYKGRFQEVNFDLHQVEYTLPEVVVLPGENPAEVILRKIIENKETNNPHEFDAYQYEVYSKIEVDANNISEKFQNRRIMRPFKFIFENMDTSTINGKVYLPIFLTESLSDYYFRKSPQTNIEVIKATLVSGIEDETISQFLGDVFQKYTFYENYISLFQKFFVSPIANFGLMYYKYYLIDSTYIGNKWCYKIMFKPRRKQELTFTGNFWVNDTTWAIKKFEMRIADDANINYVNDLVLEQEFDHIDNTYWMVTRDMIVGDFNIIEKSKKTLGFFGRKTTGYRNFVFNRLMPKEFYNSPTNVIVLDSCSRKTKEFWQENRHDSLTRDERAIYHMVDTIKTLPAFRTWVDIVKLVTTGYYEWGKVSLGPYMSLFSFNELEGVRFRFGGQTTDEFSRKIRLDAHVAYGVKDDEYKYGAGVLYLQNPNPRRAWKAGYKYDIEQLGQSQNAFREDFLLAAVFRRNPADKLSMVREVDGQYEHEWFNGLMNTLKFSHREIGAAGGRSFILNPETPGLTENLSMLSTSEISLMTRFAYREKFILGDFERISLGAKYPILEVYYGYGIPDLFGNESSYHRLQVNVTHWFNLISVGWSRFIVEGGRIWGVVPYPLLKLHEGNETYTFDEYAFNLMNYYEFASNRYVSFYYCHHFDGLFLNRIPLMRKLKWREVVWTRGVIGDIDEKNKKHSEFPDNMYTLRKPYFEAGTGVENILKIFRIDAAWRLSYLDHPDITKFGIRVSMRFDF
jgi:hypothetical protein